MILAHAPAQLLAKREVRDWPLIGRLAATLGTVFVDRSRPKTLPATVGRIRAELAAGGVVAVFPEGTTWCGRMGGTFRPAMFQAAVDAAAPVVPVRLTFAQGGTPSTVAAFIGDETLLTSLRRVVAARGLSIELKAHATMYPEPSSSRRVLARAATSVVAADAPLLATDSRDVSRLSATVGGMTTWNVAEPTRLELKGEVKDLQVRLVGGRINVVGADGPARVEVAAIGERPVTVTLDDDGALRVTHGDHPEMARLPLVALPRPVQGRRLGHGPAAGPRPAHRRLRLRHRLLAARRRRVDVTSGRDHPARPRRPVTAKVDLRLRSRRSTLDGELELETVSGEIALADSTASRVRARAISGSITCDLDNPPVDTRRPPRHDLRRDHRPGPRGQPTCGSTSTPRHRPGDQRLPRPRPRRPRAPSSARSAPAPAAAANATSGTISLLRRPVDHDDLDDLDGNSHECRVQPRPAAALPAEAARRGPKHGYELIRLLENRFHGLYAPSAGTIYPRLAADGGRRPRHAHRGRRPQGLRDHRRRPGRAGPARRASWPTLETEIHAVRGRPVDPRRRDRAGRTRLGPRPQEGAARRRPAGPQPAQAWGSVGLAGPRHASARRATARARAAAPGRRGRASSRRRPPSSLAEVRAAGPGRPAPSGDRCVASRSSYSTARSTRSGACWALAGGWLGLAGLSNFPGNRQRRLSRRGKICAWGYVAASHNPGVPRRQACDAG